MSSELSSEAKKPSDSVKPQTSYFVQQLNLLHQPFKPDQRNITGLLIVTVVLLIAQMGLIAYLIQQVFIDKTAPSQLLHYFIGLAGIAVFRAYLLQIIQEKYARQAETIKQKFRQQLYQHLFNQGPLWLKQQRAGELNELINNHTETLGPYFSGYLPAQIEVRLTPLIIALSIAWVEWKVALLLLFTAPLIPLFMMIIGKGAQAASQKQLYELGRLSGHFVDRLKGLGLIRLYGHAEIELKQIAESSDSLRERTFRVLKIAFLSSTVLEFFASISIAIIAIYLGMQFLGLLPWKTPSSSLGVGLFCLLLAPEFFAPLRRLAAHYHDRASALASLTEVHRIIGTLPEKSELHTICYLKPFSTEELISETVSHSDTLLSSESKLSSESLFSQEKVSISETLLSSEKAPFSEKTFSSEKICSPEKKCSPEIILTAKNIELRPFNSSISVIKNINFSIKKQQRLAIVGPSGCGKTTLLEALSGWLKPYSGDIFYNDSYTIGYAPQQPYLFEGTILENLKLSDPNATEQEYLYAAELAQVTEFVNKLPEKWNTRIGERGLGLSGGQARRLALARLLLRKTDILLLDEPTAFLDPNTEMQLLTGLTDIPSTIIIVTHSPVVMEWADSQLYLPEGNMVIYS